MHTATEVEIDEFLNDCRRTSESNFVLRYTEENKQTFIKLGLTKRNVKDEIRSLTREDYSSGPLDDHHSTDKIWIFGKEINGKEIYIKLQISNYSDPGDFIRTLYCKSFHFANKGLNYPYKK